MRIIKEFSEYMEGVTDRDISSLEDIFYDLVDEGKVRNIELRKCDNVGPAFLIEMAYKLIYGSTKHYKRDVIDWEGMREFYKIFKVNLCYVELLGVGSTTIEDLKNYFIKCEKYIGMSFLSFDVDRDGYNLILVKNSPKLKDLFYSELKKISKESINKKVLESLEDEDGMTKDDFSSLEDIFYDLVDSGQYLSVSVSSLQDNVGLTPSYHMVMQNMAWKKFLLMQDVWNALEIANREPGPSPPDIDIDILDDIVWRFKKNTAWVYLKSSSIGKTHLVGDNILLINKACKYLNLDYFIRDTNTGLSVIFIKNKDKIEDMIRTHISPHVKNISESVRIFNSESIDNANQKDLSDVDEIFIDLIDEGKAVSVRSFLYGKSDNISNVISIIRKLDAPNLIQCLSSAKGNYDLVAKSSRIVKDNLILVHIDSGNLIDMGIIYPYKEKVKSYVNASYLTYSSFKLNESTNRTVLIFIKNKKEIEDILRKTNYRS